MTNIINTRTLPRTRLESRTHICTAMSRSPTLMFTTLTFTTGTRTTSEGERGPFISTAGTAEAQWPARTGPGGSW